VTDARRRAVLGACLVGLGAWVDKLQARDTAQPLRFDELYAGMSPQGLVLSPKILQLRGQTVLMRGYAAPPLRADARFLVLTRQPLAICPFCATDADWPADIMVVYCREPSLVPGGQLLLVTGRLEAGSHSDPDTGFMSQIRLRDAELSRP
jgi:hypothetical protein